MRGIDIARSLNISTSALRHYESWGLVPRIERSASGYRIYTREHEAYFQCIRALIPGFGMELVRRIMPLVQQGKRLDALWLLNRAQVHLHAEKETVQRTVEMLGLQALHEPSLRRGKSAYTIGEAAEEAKVSASAIRHWEKEGLIRPERRPDNGYRIYRPSDIRKLLVIRTVQRVVYSLDVVREVLSELDNHDVAQAKEMAMQSLHYLDGALVEQMRGIACLQTLLDSAREEEGQQE
ncbi:MerR family transcriptional regulator [Paenibacillus albicereus]|uniref:MerR family transcriptional regulator n=1 Tax=Paenibacillus albicereus TaxID=2726185 RepID=A0A6H2GS90_9BACL|nr:MerR family transcriptional regulator [Paenibacillus albicereus]QJC50293.1 MerR family transcriptional regulator [Paenibacillus albicereus]